MQPEQLAGEFDNPLASAEELARFAFAKKWDVPRAVLDRLQKSPYVERRAFGLALLSRKSQTAFLLFVKAYL
jgi:hypothetical protein